MRTLTLLAGLALLLTGCGGGGDGDSGIRPSAPEYPVSAATSRNLGGLAAPTFTAAQLEAADAAILARADTLVLSDWLYGNPDATTVDDVYVSRTVECIGGTCYFAATADTGIQQLTIHELALEVPSPNERVMPVGQRYGVALAQAVDHGELAPGERCSAASYGGWLNYSAFGLLGSEFIGGELDEWGLLYSYSYGQASGSNPTVGTATWTGIVTGVDVSVSETTGNIIQGQARISFDLDGHAIPTLGGTSYWPTVDVAFTQMYDLDAAARKPDIKWNGVRVENGSFSTTQILSGSISGRFYGPNHEEVGGVFESRGTPGYSYNIMGAFGASR